MLFSDNGLHTNPISDLSIKKKDFDFTIPSPVFISYRNYLTNCLSYLGDDISNGASFFGYMGIAAALVFCSKYKSKSE